MESRRPLMRRTRTREGDLGEVAFKVEWISMPQLTLSLMSNSKKCSQRSLLLTTMHRMASQRLQRTRFSHTKSSTRTFSLKNLTQHGSSKTSSINTKRNGSTLDPTWSSAQSRSQSSPEWRMSLRCSGCTTCVISLFTTPTLVILLVLLPERISSHTWDCEETKSQDLKQIHQFIGNTDFWT